MEQLSGTIIKGYELKDRIGAGGFGVVYRAYQSTVGREMAVKIILPGYASRPEFVRRFETEAQTVARLEHMNITPLYDFWRMDTTLEQLLKWTQTNRYIPELTCNQRELYRIEPLCQSEE